MVKHADRIDEIESGIVDREGKPMKIGLQYVNVREVANVEKGGSNRIAQIDSDDLTRLPPRCEEGMSAGSAPRVENTLPPERVWRERSDPVEELFLVLRMQFIEVQPLRGEC